MNDHLSKFLLWRAVMCGQKRGTASEKDLIDIARYWWYNGYEGFNTDC